MKHVVSKGFSNFKEFQIYLKKMKQKPDLN
ncbi:Protein of unknown function [Gryllus bimaculatus]|nr:Protein of unknown function [Gryllus bimaculatus]